MSLKGEETTAPKRVPRRLNEALPWNTSTTQTRPCSIQHDTGCKLATVRVTDDGGIEKYAHYVEIAVRPIQTSSNWLKMRRFHINEFEPYYDT